MTVAELRAHVAEVTANAPNHELDASAVRSLHSIAAASALPVTLTDRNGCRWRGYPTDAEVGIIWLAPWPGADEFDWTGCNPERIVEFEVREPVWGI